MEIWLNRRCFLCGFVNQRPDINKSNLPKELLRYFYSQAIDQLTPTLLTIACNSSLMKSSSSLQLYTNMSFRIMNHNTTPQNLTILARIIAKFRFAPWEKCSSIEIAPNTPINLAFPPNIFHVILSPRNTFIKLFFFLFRQYTGPFT